MTNNLIPLNPSPAPPLPAILIGGPPHAGKSVLAYYLSQKLRRLGLPHYLARAAPDGEGDWLQEGESQAMQGKRQKKKWNPGWIAITHANVINRQLPLLVDVGGLPTPEQKALFGACTHAVLLTKTQADRATWLEDARAYALPVLADLTSELEGETRLQLDADVVRGQVGSLERGVLLENWPGRAAITPLIQVLEQVILASRDTIYQKLIGGLPTDAEFFDFGSLADHLYPNDPDHHFVERDLAEILQNIPTQTPLASYGRIPSWLAAGLGNTRNIVHQFSASDGWVRVPALCIAPPGVDANAINREFQFLVDETRGGPTLLRFKIVASSSRLTPALSANDQLPFIPQEKSVQLDGPIPFWLTIAIARAYGNPRITAPQAQG